jgi:hypothetical protein
MHPARAWQHTILLALAAAMFLVAPAARSLDLTSGAQLIEWCQAYVDDWDSPGARFCDAYLRGFVDGSPQIAIQEPSSESFTQRATRTRLGRPVSTRPKYCIASTTTVPDLVVQLLTHARDAPPHGNTDASVVIYAMLARYHRCAT